MRDKQERVPGDTALIRNEPAHRPWVIEVQDEEEARLLPIGARAVVVGSQRGVDILLADKTVSARHVELRVTPDGIQVHDLGSKNGTFVGGARIRDAMATEGTTIVVGQTTIVCSAIDDEEEEIGLVTPLPGIAGSSKVMRKIASQVRRLAKLSAPVLVTGETGVGKELIARALHTEGPRAEGAFVAMNVAALPRELVESELFGHERGAFTGAVSKRIGAFTEAEGGTLFLDEIGELPLDAQPKLLRALDGYEVRRIGSAGSGRRTNARVIVATHVGLRDRVSQGTFRRDLFHRLEVFVIELPPLRDRPGDISVIARSIFAQQEPEHGRRELTSAALAQLSSEEWPGNVRDLRNVLTRACDLAGVAYWIDAKTVERALRRPRHLGLALTAEAAQALLETHGGNVSAAARAAHVARTSFRKLLGDAPEQDVPASGRRPAKR